MNSSVLTQIEDTFGRLSRTEQLWLLEHLIHQFRQREVDEKGATESQLAAMAADPQIQQELRAIEAEFA